MSCKRSWLLKIRYCLCLSCSLLGKKKEGDCWVALLLPASTHTAAVGRLLAKKHHFPLIALGNFCQILITTSVIQLQIQSFHKLCDNPIFVAVSSDVSASIACCCAKRCLAPAHRQSERRSKMFLLLSRRHKSRQFRVRTHCQPRERWFGQVE